MFAIGFDVEVEAAGDALGKGTGRPGHGLDDRLDGLGELFHLVEILAEDLDADRRANAGGEHVDARLDRHRPGVGDAGELQGPVEFGDQLVGGHAGAPFGFRLEVDHRLEHLGRRRVGCRVGAPGLAEDRLDLGEALDDLVLGLQQLGRLGDRHARQRSRHVEQRAFVERRHELGAEPGSRVDRNAEDQQRGQDGQLLPAHDAGDDRPVAPDQRAVHRISRFRQDPAADQPEHQHRHQRHRQDRRAGHGKGLGEGERREQPPLLALQAEDRQEGDGDDQQREEQRRSHFLARQQHGGGAILPGMLRWQPLQVLVGVLDHDDGGIDHRPDGDGDAAEAHQIGVHAEQAHGDEGDEHADRQHQDRHQRAAHMQQENDADQRNDQRFLDQRSLEGGDGAVDQFGAVVDGLYRHPFGQAGAEFGDPGFQVVDHFEGILAVARHGDAGDHLAFAIEFGQAAPLVGRQFDTRDVADQHRRSLVALDHQRFEVADAAQVALAAHHVLGFGHFDDAAADVAVGIADDLHDLPQRHAVSAQLDRIDRHLVGLNETADRCDFGDAMRLAELVAQIPVLDGAQLGEAPVFAEQRVLIDPADAGRVRADLRRHPPGHAAGREVEIFEHA